MLSASRRPLNDANVYKVIETCEMFRLCVWRSTVIITQNRGRSRNRRRLLFQNVDQNFVIWHIDTTFIQRLLTVEEKLHLRRPLTAGWSSRRFMKLITACNDTVSVDKISKGSSSLPEVSPDDFQGRMRPESISYMDRIVIVFLNCRCLMQSDFVPRGPAVIQELLLNFLGWIRVAVRKKLRETWRGQILFLHPNEAPTHTALSAQKSVGQQTPEIPRLPYSSNLATTNLFCSRK
jgi:hypothetical protein